MCKQEIIDDIDAGKRVPLKKSVMFVLGFIFSSGVIGWLLTVLFWITGVDNDIAKNKEDIVEINKWVNVDVLNSNEIIYNLKRLLEKEGLEWKTF